MLQLYTTHSLHVSINLMRTSPPPNIYYFNCISLAAVCTGIPKLINPAMHRNIKLLSLFIF